MTRSGEGFGPAVTTAVERVSELAGHTAGFSINNIGETAAKPRAYGKQLSQGYGFRGAPGSSGGDLNFYVGTHQVSDAKNFDRVCISRNRLVSRRKPVESDDVLVDCAGFTTIEKHGGYPHPASEWAEELHRLESNRIVKITVAVAQDYMCEPWMLAKTGLTVLDHQRLTIERFDALMERLSELYPQGIPFEVMPVLQGFTVAEYLRHIEMYGDRLTPGMWVGVGSVCKRQGNVAVIEDLLYAITEVRPDLRLHGFRREADRPAEPGRSAAALQRRQHGVVVRSSEAGARRKRLARGRRVHPQGPETRHLSRTTAAVLTRTALQQQEARDGRE